MRALARVLLLLLVFAIPWQYSLELGEPLGNIARVLGALTLMATLTALLKAGGRRMASMQWLTLAFFLWLCASYFWSVDPATTLEHLRGNFQELMILWFVWELAEGPRDLRMIVRAFVAGLFVLALLTMAAMGADGRDRFAAPGNDPNDVAGFLDLGFPLAAWLGISERRMALRIAWLAYLPVGLAALLLTASRGGAIAALVAAAGTVVLFARAGRLRMRYAATMVSTLVAVVAGIAWVLPRAGVERILTIPEQLNGGDLNQRLGIWAAGAQALARAPLAGSGAGTFVAAAGLAPADTAHNTALAIAVEGGMVALAIALAMLVVTARAALRTKGSLRIALGTALAVWGVTSLVATVHENRTTWVLLAVIAVAGRMAGAGPEAGGFVADADRGREAAVVLQRAG